MTADTAPASPKIPRHVALIMDGNGRWAKQRGLPRLQGHAAGAKSVRQVVEEALKLRIRYLTLFSFSTENWQRSGEEVQGLMKLFQQYLGSEIKSLHKGGIRLRAVGDLARLPEAVQRSLAEVCEQTASNSALDLILAISYGGREEIVQACRSLAIEVQRGALQPEAIDAAQFAGHLWTKDIPDPDLLIRTSGELRISNFLLWQVAYSEIIVTEEFWPDFDAARFRRCIEEYSRRERRFGLTTEQLRSAEEPEVASLNMQQVTGGHE